MYKKLDDIKRCSKCEVFCLKTNFYKNKNKKDGVNSFCKICLNKYKNVYIKNRLKIDVNFGLIRITRQRIHKALNGNLKSFSTKHIVGIDINTYKPWIEYQFTPDMNWSNIEIDHVKPIRLVDVSKDEELREAFNWKNTQPLLKKYHQQKGTKFNFLDYQLQFIKAYQFIKLIDQEVLN